MKTIYLLFKFIARVCFEAGVGWRDGYKRPEVGAIYRLSSGAPLMVTDAAAAQLKAVSVDAPGAYGGKIRAIKLARELWNLSLKDAKELVEDMGDKGVLPSCARVGGATP